MIEKGDWVRYSNEFLQSIKPYEPVQHMMLVLDVGEPHYKFRRGRRFYDGRLVTASGGCERRVINDQNLRIVHKAKHLKGYSDEIKAGDAVTVVCGFKTFKLFRFLPEMEPLIGEAFIVHSVVSGLAKLQTFFGGSSYTWPLTSLRKMNRKKVKRKSTVDWQAPWALKLTGPSSLHGVGPVRQRALPADDSDAPDRAP